MLETKNLLSDSSTTRHPGSACSGMLPGLHGNGGLASSESALDTDQGTWRTCGLEQGVDDALEETVGELPKWVDDPGVRREFMDAWLDSNPYAPSVRRGQPGSLKRENGGWIVRRWFSESGDYDVIRIAPGSRARLDPRRPLLCACNFVGLFHTYQNTEAENYLPFAVSSRDLAMSRELQLPGVIVTFGAPGERYRLIPIPVLKR